MTRLAAPTLCLLAVLGTAHAAAPPSELERGDEAWAMRAAGASDEHAASEPIAAAIGAYERALRAAPGSLEIRWKLLRSLHFAAAFAAGDADPHATFERAARVGEEGLDRVGERLGSGARLDRTVEIEPGEGIGLDVGALRARLAEADLATSDVARLHFWTAIAWGSWSRTTGLLAAVREGVANRIHRYARIALALEPGYDDGGAYRLLGRLHATLPRVPFISGWVDRERAIPLLESGYTLAPWHPGNRLLLALTLLDLAPGRRDEALALLRQAAATDPRATRLVEDRAIIAEARALLSRTEAAAAP
jgi:tetratricopeptide (TPR) repeat protein